MTNDISTNKDINIRTTSTNSVVSQSFIQNILAKRKEIEIQNMPKTHFVGLGIPFGINFD